MHPSRHTWLRPRIPLVITLPLLLLAATAWVAPGWAASQALCIQFGSALSKPETTGAAAPGLQSAIWNQYLRDNYRDTTGAFANYGQLVNLVYADGTASGANVTVSGGSGAWVSGSTEPLMDIYLYPQGGATFIQITVSNLAAGTYDVYLYGHGGPGIPTYNSRFSLLAGALSYPPLSTGTDAGWMGGGWVEGEQYVVERGVLVSVGDTVVITARPGAYTSCALNGVQFVPTAGAPRFLLEPASVTAYLGEQVTLTAEAVGQGPITYQWIAGRTNITGATGPSFVLPAAGYGDAGSYQVVATGPGGSLASEPATVTVLPVFLSAARYTGLTLTGVPGVTFNIQAVASARDTNWATVGTVVLTNSPQFWFDTNSTGLTQRLYRAVPTR